MENEYKTEIQRYRRKIHRVLAESYTVYLLALVLGLFFTAVWPINIFRNNTFVNMSAILLFLSSALILWAQRSSKRFTKENLTPESFKNGPYRFTRNPTNLGLFILITCFGIIVNSFFVVLFTLIAFMISRLIFIKKEERLLENKYGKSYLEYKKSVRF